MNLIIWELTICSIGASRMLDVSRKPDGSHLEARWFGMRPLGAGLLSGKAITVAAHFVMLVQHCVQ